jgi:hypothetical protein
MAKITIKIKPQDKTLVEGVASKLVEGVASKLVEGVEGVASKLVERVASKLVEGVEGVEGVASKPKRSVVIRVPNKKVETCEKVQVKITRKITDSKYDISCNTQKPKFISHDRVTLPPRLELEPLFYQNDYYWVDRTTKYIFLPEDITNKSYVAVGKLCEPPLDVRKITKNVCPLLNRKIEWYLKYELDVPLST